MRISEDVPKLTPASGVQVYPHAPAKLTTPTSLYHECAALITALSSIPTFRRFLDAVHAPDPVNHLWSCFALGAPLVHLYSLITNSKRIAPDLDVYTLDELMADTKAQKFGVASFSIALGNLGPRWEGFLVSDLWNDRTSLDGFIKVRLVPVPLPRAT
jgi:hypothetical protein